MQRRRLYSESDDDEPQEERRGRSRKSQRATKSSQMKSQKATQKTQRRKESVSEEEEMDADTQKELDKEKKKEEAIEDAILVLWSQAHKGGIKETELKSVLGRRMFDNFENALDSINRVTGELFGHTVVHSGASHFLFVRNELSDIEARLGTLFTEGNLNGEAIDDGTLSRKTGADEQAAIDENEYFNVLFAVLTTMMMVKGVEINQKEWSITSSYMDDLVMNELQLSQKRYESWIASKTALFVREGWIRRVEDSINNKEQQITYYWGPRAIATLSTYKLFDKFCVVNQTHKLKFHGYEARLRKLDELNGIDL